MYIVFYELNGVESRSTVAAVSRGDAASRVRSAHPGCRIVAVV